MARWSRWLLRDDAQPAHAHDWALVEEETIDLPGREVVGERGTVVTVAPRRLVLVHARCRVCGAEHTSVPL